MSLGAIGVLDVLHKATRSFSDKISPPAERSHRTAHVALQTASYVSVALVLVHWNWNTSGSAVAKSETFNCALLWEYPNVSSAIAQMDRKDRSVILVMVIVSVS